MKTDCSITENYLKELDRMCSSFRFCNDCPVQDLEGESCVEKLTHRPFDNESIVQKWSDANPRKTYLEDFKSKFPNILRADSDICKNDSNYCVEILYGEAPKMRTEQGHEYSCNGRCNLCWNQPI